MHSLLLPRARNWDSDINASSNGDNLVVLLLRGTALTALEFHAIWKPNNMCVLGAGGVGIKIECLLVRVRDMLAN